MGRNTIAWLKTKTWQIKSSEPVLGISIVLAVRNEAEHIKQCVEHLLNQDYPKVLFEIIIVDDHSEDNTVAIIESIKVTNITLLHLTKSIAKNYKKRALAMGIAQAKNDIIITTDGDCKMEAKWLKTMVDYYLNNDCVLVAGPLIYETSENIFKNIQALEILGLAGITAGQFHLKNPIMCNGANLLFEKKLFKEAKKSKNYKKYASGDDIFLLQYAKEYFSNKIGFVKSKEAAVKTFAENNLDSFFQQRIRWAGKMRNKNNISGIISLLAIFCFTIILLVNITLGMLNSKYLLAIGGLMLLAKFTIDFLFLYKTAYFFKQVKLLWLFLLSQIFQLAYISLFGVFVFKRGYIWKQRKINQLS